MHTHDAQPSAEEFWEQRYSDSDRVWSGNPNPVFVASIGSLQPGSALDLGCGEGADAVWLAGNGWRVTAVDISATALRRVDEHARSADVSARVMCERHDLATSFPDGTYDLVSAQFLQTPLEFPRAEVLRRAARALNPGGLLLIVDHGAAPPWSEHAHADTYFPSAAEVYEELELDGDEWVAERCDQVERFATGPDGHSGTLIDNVIAIRRAESAALPAVFACTGEQRHGEAPALPGCRAGRLEFGTAARPLQRCGLSPQLGTV